MQVKKRRFTGLNKLHGLGTQHSKNVILQLGFHSSKADSSLFIYSQGSNLCYFMVYVDDLVITGNNSILVANIIKRLGDMISLKDMGSLHFFLGIEVIPTRVLSYFSHNINMFMTF